MVRLLLIVCLMFAGALQNFARGDVDLASARHAAPGITAEHSAKAQSKCCAGEAEIENKVSLCSFDCSKAMVAAASVVSERLSVKHSFASLTLGHSIHRLVDLRPPIS